jgi:hypothetical protein
VAALAEGPLGLLASGPGIGRGADRSATDETVLAPATPPRAEPAASPPALHAAGLPRRLLLKIDGVGSFLLLRSDRVLIGRSGPLPDLPILGDLSEHHAEIFRAGEDYFLVGGSGVEIDGRPARHALLSPGDRIQLNRRVRLTFERPSRKSTAAVLKLGDGVRSVLDVRRAILWAGPIIIGAACDSHIPLRSAGPSWILLERGGEFQLRPMPGGVGSPSRAAGALTLPIGRPVQAGDLSLSLNLVSEQGSTGIV